MATIHDPDFATFARAAFMTDDPIPVIIEQLRLIWNARGAADVATIERELSSMMGVTAAGPYVKNLDRAIRQGDR